MNREELSRIEARYKNFEKGSLPDELFLLNQALPSLLEALKEQFSAEEFKINTSEKQSQRGAALRN